MLDLELINNTITELENSDTNFANCEKLAYLYIIREYHQVDEVRQVEKELSDILPHYNKYCDLKRQYQIQHTDKEAVLFAFRSVMQEIKEFLQTLYANTDMPEEREELVKTLTQLTFR